LGEVLLQLEDLMVVEEPLEAADQSQLTLQNLLTEIEVNELALSQHLL
jgi:hypothetical protein